MKKTLIKGQEYKLIHIITYDFLKTILYVSGLYTSHLAHSPSSLYMAGLGSVPVSPPQRSPPCLLYLNWLPLVPPPQTLITLSISFIAFIYICNYLPYLFTYHHLSFQLESVLHRNRHCIPSAGHIAGTQTSIDLITCAH